MAWMGYDGDGGFGGAFFGGFFGGGYGGGFGFDGGDGRDYGSFAQKSGAAQSRENDARASFLKALKATEFPAGAHSVEVKLLKPSEHLTGPCWKDFSAHVKGMGCKAKRRAATEQEKRDHRETRKGKCYWVDVTITRAAQDKALGRSAAAPPPAQAPALAPAPAPASAPAPAPAPDAGVHNTDIMFSAPGVLSAQACLGPSTGTPALPPATFLSPTSGHAAEPPNAPKRQGEGASGTPSTANKKPKTTRQIDYD